MRKSLVFILFLTNLVFAKPELHCQVNQLDVKAHSGFSVRVYGNDEVKSFELLTPIDPQYYRKAMNQYFFYWPPWLPEWPTMFFIVNGKEIQYVREIADPEYPRSTNDPTTDFKI